MLCLLRLDLGLRFSMVIAARCMSVTSSGEVTPGTAATIFSRTFCVRSLSGGSISLTFVTLIVTAILSLPPLPSEDRDGDRVGSLRFIIECCFCLYLPGRAGDTKRCGIVATEAIGERVSSIRIGCRDRRADVLCRWWCSPRQCAWQWCLL